MPNMHSILSRSSKTILRNNYSQEEIKDKLTYGILVASWARQRTLGKNLKIFINIGPLIITNVP